MTLEALSQKKPAVLGFFQFICGFAYIALVATFFWLMQRSNIQDPPGILAPLLMITLLVFSATLMGLFFLGTPIYLVNKGNWSKALRILGFTLLYAFVTIVILVGVVLAITM
jgi:membrane protease YdiL (CAAX protease family)